MKLVRPAILRSGGRWPATAHLPTIVWQWGLFIDLNGAQVWKKHQVWVFPGDETPEDKTNADTSNAESPAIPRVITSPMDKAVMADLMHQCKDRR
jgi:hypothetical protein